MAPYCAIPRDYLSDTPLLRAMGFLVSQHGQSGAIPPPPFLSVSPLAEHAKRRCDTRPLKRGISAILARYPMKTRQISHWAAKFALSSPIRSSRVSGPLCEFRCLTLPEFGILRSSSLRCFPLPFPVGLRHTS